jgi:hypothetical protein
MPSAEERMVMHLANIGNYLHDLVKIMEAVNKNIVDFAKIVKENGEGLPETEDEFVQKEEPKIAPGAVVRSNEPEGNPPYYI